MHFYIPQFLSLYLITQQMDHKEPNNRLHYRSSDFFLPSRYKCFANDISEEKLISINDIEIEVSGFGAFKPEIIMKNFFQYVQEITSTANERDLKIRSFKVSIGGFRLKTEDKERFEQLAKCIENVKKYLKVLSIHTNNLSHVELKGFKRLLFLSLELSEPNFEEFTLQCSNWSFSNGQPRITELEQVLTQFAEEANSIKSIKNKYFRLEMSGWYYSQRQALNFLNPANAEKNNVIEEIFEEDLQNFHNEMERFLFALFDGMDEIEKFELDMRNWNSLLKMKELKKKLDQVSKKGRSEQSYMEKKNNEGSEHKHLDMKIMM